MSCYWFFLLFVLLPLRSVYLSKGLPRLKKKKGRGLGFENGGLWTDFRCITSSPSEHSPFLIHTKRKSWCCMKNHEQYTAYKCLSLHWEKYARMGIVRSSSYLFIQFIKLAWRIWNCFSIFEILLLSFLKSFFGNVTGYIAVNQCVFQIRQNKKSVEKLEMALPYRWLSHFVTGHFNFCFFLFCSNDIWIIFFCWHWVPALAHYR